MTLELPLGCHFRLAAAEGAKIGLPELDLGAVPAWGGTARLTRCIGRDRALDMILRAKKISGPEALRIGLVQELHPLERLKDAPAVTAERFPVRGQVLKAAIVVCLLGLFTAGGFASAKTWDGRSATALELDMAIDVAETGRLDLREDLIPIH